MNSRPSSSFLRAACLAAAGIAFATAAAAQHSHGGRTAAQMTEAIGCDPDRVTGYPLKQPKIIRERGGRIDTTMVVDQVPHTCFPVWDTNVGWKWDTNVSLRTYGSPLASAPDDWSRLEWTLPGPTFLAYKTYLQDVLAPPGPNNRVIEQGSRVNILLRNELPNDRFPYDECLPSSVTQPAGKPSQTCPNPPCTFEQHPPQCFHGNNVTNLHFHGTHVSPQPHQDFVLLNLFSSNQTDPPPPPPDTFNQVSPYQFNLDPFPWNQAPGTHWYHPHKHGSTSIQVANGMAGAILILGEFDDWLYGLYGVNPDEDGSLQAFDKVLIVQELQEDLNFYTPGKPAAKPTINGQASPYIQMYPGEIQRWRVIGGTTHASGVLKITLTGFTLKQISQDGVQFASENYERQPYTGTTNSFTVTPGSRMDFLVQAPGGVGNFSAKYEIVVPDLPVEVQDTITSVKGDIEEKADAAKAAEEAKRRGGRRATVAAAAPVLPDLFTVNVVAGPGRPMSLPIPRSNAACQGSNPAKNCWPATPYFLRDLPPPAAKPRDVLFSMRDPNTKICTKNAQQGNSFWVDNKQYCDCADIQMTMGTTEDWKVANDSPLPHPFHIHINPFQMVSDDANPQLAKNGPPFVWRDTVPLPVGPKSKDPDGKDTGCNDSRSVLIRQRFDDFTGAYVIHCHFLGHEDRGMMLAVETLCPEGQFFGRPEAGLPDNCAIRSPANPPACKPDRPNNCHGH